MKLLGKCELSLDVEVAPRAVVVAGKRRSGPTVWKATDVPRAPPLAIFTVTKAGSGKGTARSRPPRDPLRDRLLSELHERHRGDPETDARGWVDLPGWSGACTGTGRCTVTMNGGSKTVTATFFLGLTRRGVVPSEGWVIGKSST